MKIKVTKRAAVCLILTAACYAAAETPVYTGGIALEKTAALSKQSLPLPDGNPQPLLALAARHGTAKGHFSGKAAEAVGKQFGKAVPIYVEAVKIGKVKEQPRCDQIRLTYKTDRQFAASAPEKQIDVAVCPKR